MILHSRQHVHNAYFFLQNTRKPRTLARVKAPGTPPTLSSSVLPRTMMVLQSGGGNVGDDGDDGGDGDVGDGSDDGYDGDDGNDGRNLIIGSSGFDLIFPSKKYH